MFSEAGREPDTLKLSYIDSRGFWLDVDVDTYRSKRRVKADVVRRLRDLGADRLIVGVPLYRTEAIEPMLDAAAELWSVAEE
jgi:hypothetical protein